MKCCEGIGVLQEKMWQVLFELGFPYKKKSNWLLSSNVKKKPTTQATKTKAPCLLRKKKIHHCLHGLKYTAKGFSQHGRSQEVETNSIQTKAMLVLHLLMRPQEKAWACGSKHMNNQSRLKTSYKIYVGKWRNDEGDFHNEHCTYYRITMVQTWYMDEYSVFPNLEQAYTVQDVTSLRV